MARITAADMQDFKEIVSYIESAQSIAVAGHMSPDGDSIGSVLALIEIIRNRWSDKTLYPLLADADDIPYVYKFLEHSDTFMHKDDVTQNIDLFICVDLSEKRRLKELQSILASATHCVVFDHHPYSEVFWDAGIIRVEAAACALIIYNFAKYLGIEIPVSCAQDLFVGLMTDTGSFRYQNADADAFMCAAELVLAGADPSRIATEIYQSDSLNYLHLQALVAQRIKTYAGGRIACSYVLTQDLDNFGVEMSECESLIDLVRSVRGADIALFLKEPAQGWVRGSLRSKGNIDISGVAKKFGGGGHRAASGFSCKSSVKNVLDEVLTALEELLMKETR